MIEIKRMDNCWLIEEQDEFALFGEQAEGKRDMQRIVIEDDERDSGHDKSFTTQKLLWSIKELLGLFGSKHDEHRCWVVVKDQDGKEVE